MTIAVCFDERGRWLCDQVLPTPPPPVWRLANRVGMPYIAGDAGDAPPETIPLYFRVLHHHEVVRQRPDSVYSQRWHLYVDKRISHLSTALLTFRGNPWDELLWRYAAACLTTGLRHMARTRDEYERDHLDWRTAPFYSGRPVRATFMTPVSDRPDLVREYPVYVDDTPEGWEKFQREQNEVLRGKNEHRLS